MKLLYNPWKLELQEMPPSSQKEPENNKQDISDFIHKSHVMFMKLMHVYNYPCDQGGYATVLECYSLVWLSFQTR